MTIEVKMMKIRRENSYAGPHYKSALSQNIDPLAS